MLYLNFLSPIDDYSNLPFRLLCQKYGAEAACVPLANSTAIANNDAKISIVDAHPDEKNLGVQLVGNNSSDMGLAAKRIMDEFPFVKWLNINCGCPSARTRNSGSGSALLEQPKTIADSINEIRKHVDIPVTVKIRVKNNFYDTLAVCKELEGAGVSFIIIHGRTAGAGYSGKADWELIKSLKGQIGVPLVGNGDIGSAGEGRSLVERGYCDSFMVARAAMSNPKMFCNEQPKGISERMRILDEYLELSWKYFGEPELKDVKLKALNFVSGSVNAAEIRNSIARAKSVDEIVGINYDALQDEQQEFFHYPGGLPELVSWSLQQD